MRTEENRKNNQALFQPEHLVNGRFRQRILLFPWEYFSVVILHLGRVFLQGMADLEKFGGRVCLSFSLKLYMWKLDLWDNVHYNIRPHWNNWGETEKFYILKCRFGAFFSFFLFYLKVMAKMTSILKLPDSAVHIAIH